MRVLRCYFRRILPGLTVFATLVACSGQNPVPVSPDPLINLMMAQPKLDFSAPVTATASFDPPLVSAGQKSIYRVTLNALEQSIELPAELPVTSGLTLIRGAQGQVLQMNGTNMEPRTTFNYRSVAKVPGTYQVPEFSVMAYGKPVRVPAAQVQVGPPGAYMPAAAQDLLLQLDDTNVYVGQPVSARIMLRGNLGGIVQGISQVQINGTGLMADMGAIRQRIENLAIGRTNQAVFVYETLVTPVATGKINATAQAFTVGNRFSGPLIISGQVSIPSGPPQYILLESDPVPLTVKPLPRSGELPGFTGAIGKFTLEPPRLSTNQVKVGEPLRLSMVIRTAENELTRLSPPPAPRSREWQILEPGSDGTQRQAAAQSVMVFDYTIIPLTASATATPVIPFSYFDPQRGEHVDLSVPALPVLVHPGEQGTDLQAMVAATELESSRENQLTLGTLMREPGRSVGSLVPLQERSWFPLLQIAPGAFFLALFAWDRRRRYYEAHPDVLLRRRALKQLRRCRSRLRQVLASRDPGAFVNTAVEALRVGSAPHFPASPAALVGADILSLLSHADQLGDAGVTVRRLFQYFDAHTFDGQAPLPEWLQLGPGVLRLLDALEKRLTPEARPSKKTIQKEAEEDEWAVAAPLRKSITTLVLLGVLTAGMAAVSSTGFPGLFAQGLREADAGQNREAAETFRGALRLVPCTGGFHNLGNVEWHRGRVGHAVHAWEQALWIDPWNEAPRRSLEFGRKAAQIETPALGWFEVVSSWLPLNAWVWTAGAGLWGAVGLLMFPAVFRWRRQGWHQVLASLGLAVFLLSIPAQWGGHSRTRLGFILLNNTPLRLTPTSEGQEMLRLNGGEPVRWEKKRGDFLLVRTSSTRGWIHKDEMGLITQQP